MGRAKARAETSDKNFMVQKIPKVARSSATASTTERWAHVLVLIIVVLGFASRLANAEATPLWQGPDEMGRQQNIVMFVRRAPTLVAERRLLAPQDVDLEWQAEVLQHMRDHQFNQWVPFVLPEDVQTFAEWTGGGFYIYFGLPVYPLLVAVPLALAGPDDSLDAQLRFTRFFSVVISTITIPVAYLGGRALAGRQVGAVVAAFAAFVPMAAWLGGVVNHDNLVSLEGAVTFAAAIYLVMRGLNRWVVAAFVLSFVAGLLTKRAYVTLLPMIPVVALAVVWIAYPRLRRWARRGLVALIAAAGLMAVAAVAVVVEPDLIPSAIAGYLFNNPDEPRLLLEQDYFSMEGLLIARNYILSGFQGFFGVFGYYVQRMPESLYWIYLALLQVGILGVVIAMIRRRRDSRTWWLLAVFAVGSLSLAGGASLENLTRFAPEAVPQGRYLLPLLIPVGGLVGLGWWELVRRWRFGTSAMLSILILLAALNWIALTGTVQQFFAAG